MTYKIYRTATKNTNGEPIENPVKEEMLINGKFKFSIDTKEDAQGFIDMIQPNDQNGVYSFEAKKTSTKKSKVESSDKE